MTFRARIEDLCLGPNPPAGMNALLLLHLAYELRASAIDHDPITVTEESHGYRIHDGRHRAIAALIAGRPDVLAVMA
jgi:hypothetical protein